MAFIDKRKRSREDDNYTDSSMPLSKRINNLHLTNYDDTTTVQCSSNQLENSFLYGNPELAYNDPVMTSGYNPELNEAENPYYWKNKLLHDLHMERLKRCTV